MSEKKSFFQSLKDGFIDKPLSLIDWILFIVIAGFCFLSFQQGDLMHTGGSSIALLNGHFLDFYEYNAEYMVGNNYMLTTYILFAIWNIPIRLLGLVTIPTTNVKYFVMMWYKLLPTLFFLASAFSIYKIAMQLGFGRVKSKLAGYIFLTTPIAFFSQFIFGQYDSLTVFFVLLGVFYFFKKDHWKFVLFFGIAMTLKYTALLIFLVLLLLREKKVSKIIMSAIASFVPMILVVLPYISSEAFHNGVFGFGAMSYIFHAAFKIGRGTVSVVVVAFLVICAWAYFTESKDDIEEARYALFFCNGIMFLLFGLTLFHPQWLLLAMPFIVLSTMISKYPDTFLWIDMIMMGAMTGFTVNYWIKHVDQALMRKGILRNFTTYINDTIIMSDLFIVKDTTIWYSILSACFLINFIFKHPKYTIPDFKKGINKHWNLVRARFVLGVSIFVVPALICLVVSNTHAPVFSPGLEEVSPYEPLMSEDIIEQEFVANNSSFSKIKLKVGTYKRENNSKLKVEIFSDLQDVIFSEELETIDLVDNAVHIMKTDKTELNKGETYTLRISALDTDENNYVTIYKTEGLDGRFKGNAIINGEEQNYNFAVSVSSF